MPQKRKLLPPDEPAKRRKEDESNESNQLKYLNTIVTKCGKKLKLFSPDSQKLINNWQTIGEKARKKIRYLYWNCPDDFVHLKDAKYRKEKVLGEFDLRDVINSLLHKGFITAPPEDEGERKLNDYKHLLTTQKFKKTLKVIRPKSKDMNDLNALNRTTEQKLSLRLKDVLKRSYKLSELAKKTFFEISVLMHLGTLGQPLYEAPATKYVNNRPKLVFTSNMDIKRYLDNDLNDVDDDVEIFQTRDEFLGYINAYNYTNDIFDKKAFDKDHTVNTLKKLKTLDGEQVKRFENQPWLCKFTPAYCYMEILDEAMKYPQNYEEENNYKILLEALDCLIGQDFFRQEKKAKWRQLKIDFLTNQNKNEKVIQKKKFKVKSGDQQIVTNKHQAWSFIDDDDIIDVSQEANKGKAHARNKYFIKKQDGEKKEVISEVYSINHYKNKFPKGEHLEGRWVRDAFLLLFWDIIHTKPEGVVGVFLTPGQKYPLDMFSEHFYKNRKASIDNRLLFIKNSDTSAIIEEMEAKLNLRKQQSKTENRRTKSTTNEKENDLQSTMIDWEIFPPVVQCLGAPALAAICERLAHNLAYWLGFPDLTLWNEDASDPKEKIQFREVKTKRVTAQQNQLDWLQFLRDHGINAGLCCIQKKKKQKVSDTLNRTVKHG